LITFILGIGEDVEKIVVGAVHCRLFV